MLPRTKSVDDTNAGSKRSALGSGSVSHQPPKASAISKQVLKNSPIPQPVRSKTTLGLESSARPKVNQPLRSSKVSQKLVLFPQPFSESETTMQATLPIDNEVLVSPTYDQRRLSEIEEEQEPWRYDHAQLTAGVPLPTEWTFGSRTPAERMPKDERDFAGLPRVAAYCTGEGYDLNRLRPFLRQHHHVTPRLYDECLYAAYYFPLMTLRPDKDNLHNIRIRSASPRPARRDATEEEEAISYDEDHYPHEGGMNNEGPPRPGNPYPEHYHSHPSAESHSADTDKMNGTATEHSEPHGSLDQPSTYSDEIAKSSEKHDDTLPEPRIESISAPATPYAEQVSEPIEVPELAQDIKRQHRSSIKPPFKGGEVFIFDYGVVVFWNFHRAEELLMLEDLNEFSIRAFRDNPDEDMQIEEMHFQYDTSQLKPRIFNDMITLKSGNHMIKLTLSHGLSQSAVLARYEDIMDKTIEEMAQTGRLDKNRAEITKINGELFSLRMNVNLVSNVLDTPEIFWSEPALQPMYNAIREYLEIPQRAKILNDRLRVISDMLSMLRDHLNNFGVEYQTLLVIYLIIVAVIVACFEIAVKILQSIEVM
ncbi:uncharacterized protein BYT42DRAFT_632884 [Radiomyces spectabilis]|uniref:uncharacterized protein n=1 Tax=Radiomyces spectabilis TaxID=64574 RepID=UPI00221F18AF|nr:uncharacterized protein BYT42DRAFT_632884 [Radiomyces spectabilis]KAI8384483.1 hypothetical protein BYT42DRAFT_632884 [Radiomyces spectabilis]